MRSWQSIVEYDVTEKKVEYCGREGGSGQVHLPLIKVKSSHSLLVEVVVWQHPILCLCEDPREQCKDPQW